MMSPELLITTGGLILSAGIAWGVSKRTQDTLRERLDKFERDAWREVGKLRDWRHQHELDSSNARRELERESSHIRESVIAKDSKLDVIINRLENIEKKIDKIETREEENRG